VQTPDFSLHNKQVIVTGAGQGIGKALAATVVALGGRVVAVDVNAGALDALRAELGDERCVTVTGSVADAAVAQAAVSTAWSTTPASPAPR